MLETFGGIVRKNVQLKPIKQASFYNILRLNEKLVLLPQNCQKDEHLDYHSPNIRRPVANGRGIDYIASSREDEGCRTP